MFKIVKLFAISGLIAISSTSFAELNYTAKLEQLQNRIEVGFSANLPFVKKIESINHLYDLVFQMGITEYFGKGALIQKVSLIQPYTAETTSADTEIRASLREHALLLNADGTDSAFVMQNLPVFHAELSLINEIETQLFAIYPKLKIERMRDLLFGTTAANSSYLNHLDLLNSILSDRSYRAALARFDVIQVVESSHNMKKSSCMQYPQQTFENGKLVTRKVLRLELSYDGPFQQRNYVTELAVRQLLNTIAIANFSEISFSDVDSSKQANDLMEQFSQFLTPEKTLKIQAKGIRRLYFTDRLERETDWIHGDTLLLGTTRAQMDLVYSTLFGN